MEESERECRDRPLVEARAFECWIRVVRVEGDRSSLWNLCHCDFSKSRVFSLRVLGPLVGSLREDGGKWEVQREE